MLPVDKSIREVRDFLNSIPEEFLDRRFVIQQENDAHCMHFMDFAEEDLYYDPDNDEMGCLSLAEWEEYDPETPKECLKIGIPKGCPMFAEDFEMDVNNWPRHFPETGIGIIARERERQIEKEGYTEKHDNKYKDEELAAAAAAYLTGEVRFWPFELKFWKPTPNDRIRELAKAGALIAAQIDILQKQK